MLFHRHIWIEDKSERKVIPSRLKGHLKTTNMWPEEISDLLSDKYIYFYKCSKCGSEKVIRL